MDQKAFVMVLFAKAQRGESLVADEMELIGDLICGQDLDLMILANAIFTIVGNKEQQQKAIEQLRHLCENKTYERSDFATAILVSSLEYFPKDRILDPKIKAFIYQAAAHDCMPVRLNAIRVLRYLWQRGDQEARVILEKCCNDSSPHVRESAKCILG